MRGEIVKVESDTSVEYNAQELAKQIVDEWPDFVAAYPQIRTAVLGGQDICVPVNNVIENNRYCKVKQYLDATAEQISGWHSTARNNSEVHTC